MRELSYWNDKGKKGKKSQSWSLSQILFIILREWKTTETSVQHSSDKPSRICRRHFQASLFNVSDLKSLKDILNIICLKLYFSQPENTSKRLYKLLLQTKQPQIPKVELAWNYMLGRAIYIYSSICLYSQCTTVHKNIINNISIYILTFHHGPWRKNLDQLIKINTNYTVLLSFCCHIWSSWFDPRISHLPSPHLWTGSLMYQFPSLERLQW